MKKNKNWQKEWLWKEYKFVWGGAFYKKKDFYKMKLEDCVKITRTQQTRWFGNTKNRLAWFGD